MGISFGDGVLIFGGAVGIGLGTLGGRLHHRLPGGGITARYEGIYAVGIASLPSVSPK